MPLVSLEEAIKPVQHLFTSLKTYVCIAKKNCQNPKDDLTQDKSASIYLYKMDFDPPPSFYQEFNSVLQSEQRDPLRPWLLHLRLFITAAYKLPSEKATIWRGVRDVDLSSNYQTGSDVTWWGVSCCTLDMEVLANEKFLGKYGMRTICCIETEKGKKTTAHSCFRTEHEIILILGTCLRVHSKTNPADNLHIIHLKEMMLSYQPIDLLSEFLSKMKNTKKPGHDTVKK
ncbi:unnamed protein product [Adineta ricciae]|uniref:Mono(ADP-ribosyl)transferase n=1 Tax=Adineta ricciae TaxID=249248 RepID=A0A815NT26_ADIRI|nr:unnamed protein product [Adineta ricciae]CAF1438732.1 unnamed protein product [Adineta ricciae]